MINFHLPVQLASKNARIIGKIGSLTEYHPRSLQFLFIPENSSQKIWVSWYGAPPVHLYAGDIWELHLKIQPAHKNWLLFQNINAQGSVQMDFKNQLIQHRQGFSEEINHLREIIYYKIKKILNKNKNHYINNMTGFMTALTVGVRNDITEVQWQDLRATGTNHLMAIAGLHIGFFALFVYEILNFFWRRFSILMLFLPAQEAAIIFSLCGAVFYSMLAGFSLPAERAVIMLSVFLWAKLSRVKISAWSGYFLAAGIILALSPLSMLTPTFWLSFGAVGLLIYGCSGRVGRGSHWRVLLRAQWIMALGLVPLSFLFFHQVSLIGFLANCIAIPFVGFVILPLCFLGIINHYCWILAAFLLGHFWVVMHFLGSLPESQWQGEISMPVFMSIFMGIFLLLAPRGFPQRWLGLAGFLPLLSVWSSHWYNSFF